MKYIAIFTPQAWINDHARDVDAAGPIAWDVTHAVSTADEDTRQSYLDGGNEDADELRELSQTPKWVREWDGPFEVHVQKMEDEEAEQYLALHGEPVSLNTQALPLVEELRMLIPDRDGRYGRGLRDGLESFSLALLAAGVDPGLLTAAMTTVTDAISNNDPDPTADGTELHDLMVVCTAHLTRDERETLERDELDLLYVAEADPEGDAQIVVSFRNEYGYQLYVPSQGKGGAFGPHVYEACYPELSAGFAGVIRRAVELGCEYVRFDTDAEALTGVPTFDDNPEVVAQAA